AVAKIEKNYRALDEPAKQALLIRLLNEARPLQVVGAEYSPHTISELAIFALAKRLRERFGSTRCANCVAPSFSAVLGADGSKACPCVVNRFVHRRFVDFAIGKESPAQRHAADVA
ncbi:MAG: phosphoenolpyruvate carboxylase, partial [Betaproteobacteria bacterium]|nr:phosphoenolpyruvate carboxylase [Betaproteobacteria bacterium]